MNSAAPPDTSLVDFHFDVMCPWAPQTSVCTPGVPEQSGHADDAAESSARA